MVLEGRIEPAGTHGRSPIGENLAPVPCTPENNQRLGVLVEAV